MQQGEVVNIVTDPKINLVMIGGMPIEQQLKAMNAALQSNDYQPAQNPETLEKDYFAFASGYQSAEHGEIKGRAKICYNAGQQLRQAEIRKAQAEKKERNTAKQKRNAANRMKRAEENRALQMKKAKGGK